VQDTYPADDDEVPNVKSVAKTKVRSFKYTETTLSPCFVPSRDEPNLGISYSDPNKVRCDTFKSRYEELAPQTVSAKGGIDLSLLPPCKTSLKMHILRANYQSYIWKHAHIAKVKLPKAVGYGWKRTDDGSPDVKWTTGPLFPPEMLDKLETIEGGDESEESQETTVLSFVDDGMSEDIEVDELDNIIDEVFETDDE